MQIPNLLLNVNYKEACGQSSVLQHLLTYSYNTGILPQQLDCIADHNVYIWKDGERVVGLPSIHSDFINLTKEENYFELLKESLSKCVDIEHESLLDSDFKFCLPSSVNPGNLMEEHPEQCMYFAQQTGPIYTYDYNVRFNRNNTIIFNKDNLRKLSLYYKIPNSTFDELLTVVSEKISPQNPTRVSNFIKDKPIALVDTALEHGFDYTNEEGTALFIKEFLKVENTDNYSEMKNVTIFDISQLTGNRSTSEEYHKYICDSLDISPNLKLYEKFYDIFVKAGTKDRLKTITRSDFLTNILCNETDTN
jgi:hypothetical protein